MLLLTESTLFFINLLRSSSRTGTARRAQVLTQVAQWTTEVQEEHRNQAASEWEPEYAPSTSTGPSTVPSSVLSNTTQSSAATSIDSPDEVDKGDLHGAFGEDGDDSLECEDTLKATGVDKRVSRT